MVFVGERKKKKEGPLFHCEQRKREREREMFPRLLIGWRGPEDESRTRRFFVTGIGYITRNFWWEAVRRRRKCTLCFAQAGSEFYVSWDFWRLAIRTNDENHCIVYRIRIFRRAI